MVLEELDGKKVVELKRICQRERIPRYSKLKKKDLIQHIKYYQIIRFVEGGIDALLAI